MHYDHVNVLTDGAAITANPDHSLNIPDFQVILFIGGGQRHGFHAPSLVACAALVRQ